MEAWNAPIRDTKRAACYAALGFPVRVEHQLDAETGHSAAVFYLGKHAAPGFPPCNMSELRAALDNGSLQQTDPTHPLLTGLRAMHNFDKLLDCMKRGIAIRLTPVVGGYLYKLADSMHAQPAVVIETRDIDACAALATLGVPVVSIQGVAPHCLFTLAAYGIGTEKVDAALLLKAFRTGDLPEQGNAFVDGMNARSAYRQIMDFVKGTKRSVLIRKPNTRRRAIVMEHANGKVMDNVRKHFLIP